MKAVEMTLQQILYCPNQYVIPVFQRYYVWEDKHWEQLWDDLMFLLDLDPSGKGRRHFMGSIACVPEPNRPGVVPAYQVIDGQQRLITLTILLCVLRDAAVNLGCSELASEVEENYLIQRFKKESERYKVFPRLRDRQSYLALVDQKAQTANLQIAAAYVYLSEKLKNDELELLESSGKLRSLFETLVNRLDFVMIILEGENPFKIFKSLNSTGQKLEQGDLIRNHIFMAMRIADQDAFDDVQWHPLERHFEKKNGELEGDSFTAFFRDVLMQDGKYVGENSVFETFEKKYPLPDIKPSELVASLERSAKHHDIIRGKATHSSKEVEQAIRAICSLNATTAYPLVLALLDAHDANKLPRGDLVACLRAISGFVLRRYVCGEQSRAYGRWFCSACKSLGDSPLANLTAFLMDKGWPSDDTFIPSFQRMNLYGGKYGRAVLEGIEQSIQADSEPVLLDSCQIEHILPQSVTDDADGKAWQAALGDGWRQVHELWVHTPGNLTLVGSDYNIAMQKKAFAAKKPLLMASRVYLNKHFAEPSLATWTEETIKARGLQLGSSTARVWAGPPLIGLKPVAPANASTLANRVDTISRVISPVKPADLTRAVSDMAGYDKLNRKGRLECSRMLARAIDMLWHRIGETAHSKFQTHSESHVLLEHHPRLLLCVKHIFEENQKRAITTMHLSPGACSALMYLMGSCATDGDQYRNAAIPREELCDWGGEGEDNWRLANSFWAELSRAKQEADMLWPVREAIANLYREGDGNSSRWLEKSVVLAKAWEVFRSGKGKVTAPRLGASL